MTAKPSKVIVERHRYVLDWYEIDKVEFDIEKTHFEFNYRFGADWYLQAKQYDGEKWVAMSFQNGRETDFRLSNPGAALAALGKSVTAFSAITTGMEFHKALADIMNRASAINSREVKL